MMESSNTPEIAAAYDEWSQTYDDRVNRTVAMAAEILRRADLSLSNQRVVEIGCGTGRNTAWLAARAASVDALDFSEGMLRQAKARVGSPQVRFIQHDVRNRWPLADDSADVVIVMLVLEHVEDLDPVFAEAARVLGRDGQLFLCELHPARQLEGKKARFTNANTGEDILIPAFLHETDDYVRAAFSSGFEIVNIADWHDDDSDVSAKPRIISLHFRLSKRL
jgi:malonyl-CoA O-methyltransferase